MKLNFLIAITALTLLFSNDVSSQSISRDSLKALYERETILYYGGSKYIKNGEKYKIGFMGNKIRKEFEISPDAMKEYSIYKKRSKNGLIITGIGYAASVAALAMIEESPDASLGLMLGGYVTMAVGVGISISGTKHFAKAVWYRNRDAFIK